MSSALLLVAVACSSERGSSGEAAAAVGTGGASVSGSESPFGSGGGHIFLGPEGAASASGAGGTPGDAGALEPYVLPPSITLGDDGVALCGTAACACTNGLDDDGDGKIDGFDEECTGAIDDDEGTFATGIPGDNSDPKWQDCFFDGNSGAGDDHCRYHADCLTGAKPASDPACAVSDACHDFCEARTPNGCDCFGCCTVYLEGSGSVDVVISETCSLENVDDPALCPRCTPSTLCGNPCGECELCPGKGVEDLPETCASTPGGAGGAGSEEPPAYACDAGRETCGSSDECPAGEYCSLGCCLAFVIR